MSDEHGGKRQQNGNGNQNQNQQKRNTYAPKRGPIIDLEPLLNTEVTVRMLHNHSVRGTLVGYDQLMNVVIADATITGEDKSKSESESKVKKIVCLGRSIVCFEPMSGYAVIENPGVDLEFVI